MCANFIAFFDFYNRLIFSIVKIDRAVYLLQISTYLFSILVGHEFTAVSDLMNYIELVLGFGENRSDSFTKPCQIIVTSDENIRNSSIFEVGTDTCIEACRFVFRYPCPEYILSSFHIDAEYRVDTFADDTIILAGIEYNAVKEHYRIYLFKDIVNQIV